MPPPSPPPLAQPPCVPLPRIPPPTSTAILRVVFTASGTVEDFTTELEAAILAALATAAGLETPPAGSRLVITTASVRIEALMPMASLDASEAAAAGLTAAMSSPANATALFERSGIEAFTVETPVVVVAAVETVSAPPASGPLSSETASQMSSAESPLATNLLASPMLPVLCAAAAVIGVAVLVLAIVLARRYRLHKRREERTNPGTNANGNATAVVVLAGQMQHV